MKVIREQLIEAADFKTYTDFISKYNISAFNEKMIFFGLSFFYCFFETADLQSYCGYFLATCQLCCFCFLTLSERLYLDVQKHTSAILLIVLVIVLSF